MLRVFVTGISRRSGRRSRDWLLTEAVRVREAGDPAAAASILEPFVADCQDDADAQLLLADIRRELGDTAGAERIVRGVIAAEPERAEGWVLLGAVLRDAGDARRAAEAYMRALSLAPEDLAPRIELAVLLIGLAQATNAIPLLQYVLNRDPDSAEAHGNMGIALQRLNRLAEAVPHFERAVALNPADALLQNNLALAYRELGRLDEAAHLLRAAHSRKPGDPTTINNLAIVLADLGRAAEARALVEPLVEARPEFHEARCTLAHVLQDLGELDTGLAHIERVLARQPQNADVRMMKALHLLSLRDFERGWREYTARMTSAESPRRSFPFPEWQGESLSGKSVLVYAEQGIGDEIMFANCFGDLLEEARRVVIECDPRLAPLFARSFPGAEVFPGRLPGPHPWLEQAGEIDVQVPAGSLPRRYRSSWASFPRHRGYLRPDPEKVAHFRARLAGLGSGRKMGIAWRGGLAKTRRALRSIEPRELEALLGRPELSFVCLQHAATTEDTAAMGAFAPGRFHHWPEALVEADETAALMSALDCIVTVCSYVVHLGGALGLDVRVLVPASPEWRYLRAGQEMPWYPAARLFRQRPGERWANVVRAVAPGV
ncbi:MAG: tetratricopeptide repeat protein [Burkholderiales bacterium]|nr:tetratricopeptide repeat protein [Burkholderiales bacterium]